jgi:hypothetical protein
MNPIALYRGLSSVQKTLVSFALIAVVGIVLHYAGGGHSMPFLFAATVANSIANPTLLDAVRQQAPNGSLLPIVESLSLLCPALNDITMLECNNGTFHRINRRTALPAPVRRRINKGVAATKSDTQQVDEVTTELADKSVIDQEIIDRNGPEYRAREVAGHMMGLEQNVESDILNGSIGSDPDGIDGLITRLALTTQTPGGTQIVKVDASPSGSDQMSILLVGYAPHGVHGIYPKGFPGGIKHQDFGLVSNGGTDGTNTFPAWVDWFTWHHGIAVEDWRYVGRACNIDSSAISVSGTNAITPFITLYHRCLVADKSARWTYYAPRFLAEMLHQQARTAVTNSTLRIEEVAGVEIVKVMGIPLRTAEKMTITESIVS